MGRGIANLTLARPGNRCQEDSGFHVFHAFATSCMRTSTWSALSGSLHTGPEHPNGFREARLSRFLSFRIADPAAVFLAVRVAQLFKRRKHAFLLHQLRELRWHLNGPHRVVALDDNLDSISRALSDPLANCLEDWEHMLRTPILHHGSGVGHAVERHLYRHVSSGAEFLLCVVWEQHARPATAGRLDCGFEFVSPHRSYVSSMHCQKPEDK